MPLGQAKAVKKRKLINKHYAYVFTLFSDSDFTVWSVDVREYLERTFRDAKYVFQWEKGGDTDRDHLQGYIEFPTQRHYERIRVLLNEIPQAKPCHLEACKSKKSAILYCSKHDTRVAGPWHRNIAYSKLTPPDIRQFDPIQGVEPYEWQCVLLDTVNGPPVPRHVYWIWEPEGNVGKTAIAKHLCCTRRCLYVSGQGKDILYAVGKYMEESGQPEIIIFDFPRSAEGYVSYGSIEKVKDGLFFSGKFESRTVVMGECHVVCFSNSEPDLSKLSGDRWVIRRITNKDIDPLEEDD